MKGLRTTCLLFSDPKAAQVIAAAGSEDLQHFMSLGGSLMLRGLTVGERLVIIRYVKANSKFAACTVITLATP